MFLKLPNYLILNFIFIKKLFLSIVALICFSLSGFAAEVPSTEIVPRLTERNVQEKKVAPGDCILVRVQTSTLFVDPSMSPDDPEAYTIVITITYYLICEE